MSHGTYEMLHTDKYDNEYVCIIQFDNDEPILLEEDNKSYKITSAFNYYQPFSVRLYRKKKAERILRSFMEHTRYGVRPTVCRWKEAKTLFIDYLKMLESLGYCKQE